MPALAVERVELHRIVLGPIAPQPVGVGDGHQPHRVARIDQLDRVAAGLPVLCQRLQPRDGADAVILMDHRIADADFGGLEQVRVDAPHRPVVAIRTAADQVCGSDRQHTLRRKPAIGGGGERQQRSLRRLGHGRPVVQRGRACVDRLLDSFGQETQVARAAEQHDPRARGQRRLGDLREGAHRPALFDEAGRRIARLGQSLDGPLCHRRGPGVFVHHLTRCPAGTPRGGIGAQQQQAAAAVVRRG